FLFFITFLLVIIYLGAEFLWFNIYSQHFNESELTEFLGLMRMVNAVIQVMLLYGITRPLLRWLGVARLNAVYPLTTLVSLSGLLINFNLPAAIALHINGDALYKAINLPIHQLNYNGIPHQYVGRIRALSDGLIYSLGLTLAGVGLWLFHLYCNLEQITWLAIGFSFVLLLVRLPMGRFYAQSLEEMIRSDTINLDDFTDAKTFLPPQSSKVIQEFLCSDDQMTIAKGLELAASLGNYKQFLPEVQAKLADSSLRPHIVKLLRQGLNADNLQQLANLLTATNSNIRATALEILLVNQYSFQPEKLELLINDSDKQIRTLARVAALVNNSAKIDSSLANQLVPTEITETTAQAIARIVNYSQNPKLISVIKYLLPQASPATKQLSLNALANLAQPQDKHLAQIAAVFTNHSEPAVRIAAFKLLEITRCAAMLETVTTGLNDDNPQVRQQVANTLAAYGETGLAIAQKNLTSSKPEIVNTAITAIAKVKSKQKNEILYKHLIPEFQHLNLTRKWQKQIPTSNPSWQLLAVALEDYQKRLLQKVLYILSCLGYSRTVSLVQRILATNERRDLANAIEVLASINHRRFIQPLIPLLEKYVAQPSTIKIEPTPTWLRNKGYKILLEALESRDRWIKTGASIALTMIPTALLKDPDPIVQSVAKEIFPTQLTSHVSISMNQLLLLRKVALFKNLSLDELFSLNQALESRRVLAGETIYTEGSWGWHLYIIAEGRIQIVKEVDGKTQEIKQLTPGEYFGEIALFDEAPRWDGAIALEDSRLLSLEKKRFISLIAQRPHIILEICRFLSKRLRETDKYLSAQKMPASTAQMTNYQSLQQALDS
ncbi:MAG: cyclic nucleotide-binding domain-containing protein, partial [Cyanobacteria bacterium J083]